MLGGRSAWWWIGVAAGMVAIAVVVLVVLVIFGQAAGVQVFAANDLVLLLTVLAGLMGTVFVVGGLIVALVAVVESLTVRERIRAVLDEQDRKLDQRFADQQVHLHAQADRQIEGYITLLRMEDASDWPTAEALTQEALDLYPGLPRARSTLGMLMAAQVIQDFAAIHGRIDPVIEERFPLGHVRANRAGSWLERALDQGDDPDGQTMAGLALMYGANGPDDHDRMIAMLTRVSTSAPARLMELCEPQHLSMLAYGCGNDEARLHELGSVLKVDSTLPLSAQSIMAAARDLEFPNTQTGRPYSSHIACYAMGRPIAWNSDDQRRFPIVVQILLMEDAQQGRVAQPTLPGGLLTDHQDVFTSATPEPLADVVAKLDALFYFVAVVQRP